MVYAESIALYKFVSLHNISSNTRRAVIEEAVLGIEGDECGGEEVITRCKVAGLD